MLSLRKRKYYRTYCKKIVILLGKCKKVSLIYILINYFLYKNSNASECKIDLDDLNIYLGKSCFVIYFSIAVNKFLKNEAMN